MSLDSQRFDCLSRSLGAETSRRNIAKTLAGVALAGAVAPLGIEIAAAAEAAKKCGAKGDQCTTNGDCCKGLKCKHSGRCKYKSNCGAKKGQYCKKDKDCCNGKNLECKGHKCKRKKN